MAFQILISGLCEENGRASKRCVKRSRHVLHALGPRTVCVKQSLDDTLSNRLMNLSRFRVLKRGLRSRDL